MRCARYVFLPSADSACPSSVQAAAFAGARYVGGKCESHLAEAGVIDGNAAAVDFGTVESCDGGDLCSYRSAAFCACDAERSNHFFARAVCLLYEVKFCFEARGAVSAHLFTV